MKQPKQHRTRTSVRFKSWLFLEALRETWWVFGSILSVALITFVQGSNEAAVACVIVAGVYLVYLIGESTISRHTTYRCPKCGSVSYSDSECEECGTRYRVV